MDINVLLLLKNILWTTTEDLLFSSVTVNNWKKIFFCVCVKTIIEWNHLVEAVVHAETVEGFKTLLYNHGDYNSLQQCYTEKPCSVQKQKQKVSS